MLWVPLGTAVTMSGLAKQLECVGCSGGSLFERVEDLSPFLP